MRNDPNESAVPPPARDVPLVPHGGTRDRAYMLAVLFICAAGLMIRWVCFFQTNDVPFLHHLVGDARSYWDWAVRIAQGDWVGSEPFYQAPLYPYLLAIWFKSLGQSISMVRGVQALLTTVSLGALVFGIQRLWLRNVAFISGTMLALYAPSIFFDGIVQKESVAAALGCLLIVLIAGASESQRAVRFLGIGIVLGLLCLLRENLQIWIPFILFWSWQVKRKSTPRAFVYPAFVLLGCLMILLSVAVRNRAVRGAWSISTFQMGPNFYIGNGNGADGRYRPLVRGHETPVFEQADASRLAEGATGRAMTAHEVSRYWLRRSVGEIKAHPARWFALLAKKFMMTFNSYEVTDGESQYVYAAYSPVLGALGAIWNFGVLCPLAAIGLWATRSRWRELWIFYALIFSLAATTTLFYVLARYRFPMVPLLVPFAAVGLRDLWMNVRARNWAWGGKAGVVALLVAVFVHLPVHDQKRLDALAWMNVGVALAEDGDVAGAVRFFALAVEEHPSSAEANMNLAQALALSGDYLSAIPHYEAALAADPTLVGLAYNLAVAYEHVGRLRDALAMFRRAVEIDRSDAEARAAAERIEN